MNIENIGKRLFLWDRTTTWLLKKHWKNWDQAKNYTVALTFGGFMGSLFLYSFVVSLFTFDFWFFKLLWYYVVGVPCLWLMFLSLLTGMRLAPLTSAVPYGKPCRISLDDKLWIRFLVYWRRNVKAFNEHDLVRSFSKHHNNQHPVVQNAERKYALKIIFGF